LHHARRKLKAILILSGQLLVYKIKDSYIFYKNFLLSQKLI